MNYGQIFINLMNISPNTQESKQTPRENVKKITPRHFIIKLFFKLVTTIQRKPKKPQERKIQSRSK